MRIALGQVNTTVGDVPGNADLIVDAIRGARDNGCSLAVFPELAVTGYPPRDLLEKRSLVADNLLALEGIARECRGIAALVGFVQPNPSGMGKPLHNAAALLRDGAVAAVYRKSLLPTYDVFDEGRYFEPGDDRLVFELEGLRFGVTICEDIWRDQASVDRHLYRADPLGRLRDASLDWLLNMSASPFSLRKEEVRRRIAASIGGDALGVVYCNLVGGNDELIFDGASFVLDRSGEVVTRAASFAADLAVFDTGTRSGDLRPSPESDEAALAAALTLGLSDYVAKCGFSRVTLGLSGGVDSAVTAALAVRALGASNVVGVLMPSAFTSAESLEDARALAEALAIRTWTIPIDGLRAAYEAALAEPFRGRPADAAEENIQARIRGNLLMALSNKFGWLVVNTGNKSELAMGYCTLYGDMTGGLSVLGDVPKTTVYRLARRLNGEMRAIPERVFTKPPSAELRPGQKDSDSLPPYEVLDPILRLYIEDNLEVEAIIAAGHPADVVARVVDTVDRNEYKRRQAPPVLRVTSKAFGIGRRLPIAQRFRHPRAD